MIITLAIDEADLRKLHKLLRAVGTRHIKLMVSGVHVESELIETARKWAAIAETRLKRTEL